MTKLSELFANAKLPALLCVASDNGSDQEEAFTFSKISDQTTGKGVTILSNLAAPKSPLTGEEIDVSGMANMETAAMAVKDTLAAFKCIASCLNCNHDTLTIPELAEELDAKSFHCMNCGEEVTAFYDGDLITDESADDLEEDESEDVVDAISDEDSEDDDSDVEDEDVTSDEDSDDLEGDDSEDDEVTEDSESEDNVDADPDSETDEEEDEDVSTVKASGEAPTTETQPTATVETVEQPVAVETPAETTATETQPAETDANSTVEIQKDEATETQPAATTEEAPVVEIPAEAVAEETAPTMTSEVVVASVADYTANLQFATLPDNSRYEVFLGNTHIGSLLKDEASTGVQNKFASRDVVRNAFGSAFWKHSKEIASGEFASLKDFGFKPSTVSVDLNQVVANIVDEKVAELETKHEEAVKEASASVVASMNIAAAGVNKGMLSGTNFHTELAKLLSGYGVKAAADVAARFVEKHTPGFFDSVVTAAADLRRESPDYVRGIAASIEKASFKAVSNNENEMLATSALLPTPARTEQPAPRTAEVETASAPTVNASNFWNRYRRSN